MGLLSLSEDSDVFLRTNFSASALQLMDDKSHLNQLQESFDYERC